MATEFRTGSTTFQITGYSFTKRIGHDDFIRSDSFTVGGYKWAIQFYPYMDRQGIHVAARLQMLTDGKTAKGIHAFYLKDFSSNKWTPIMRADNCNLLTYSTSWMLHRDKLIKKSDLEAQNSKHLKDDTLSIKCTVWVSK